MREQHFFINVNDRVIKSFKIIRSSSLIFNKKNAKIFVFNTIFVFNFFEYAYTLLFLIKTN